MSQESEAATGPWPMFAGTRVGPDGLTYWMHTAMNPRSVRAHGAEPQPVTVHLDPDGPYWGYLRLRNFQGKPLPNPAPTMIYGRESLFRICFPYGPEEAEKTGEGRVVRLRIEADPGQFQADETAES